MNDYLLATKELATQVRVAITLRSKTLNKPDDLEVLLAKKIDQTRFVSSVDIALKVLAQSANALSLLDTGIKAEHTDSLSAHDFIKEMAHEAMRRDVMDRSDGPLWGFPFSCDYCGRDHETTEERDECEGECNHDHCGCGDPGCPCEGSPGRCLYFT